MYFAWLTYTYNSRREELNKDKGKKQDRIKQDKKTLQDI